MPSNLLVELPEVGRDVVELDVRVVRHEVAQVGEEAAVRQLDRPPGGEHPDIDRVRAGRPVGQQLLEEVGERDGRDIDGCAGHLLELLAPLLEAAGNDRSRSGEDVDGDALVLHLGAGDGRERGRAEGRGADGGQGQGSVQLEHVGPPVCSGWSKDGPPEYMLAGHHGTGKDIRTEAHTPAGPGAGWCLSLKPPLAGERSGRRGRPEISEKQTVHRESEHGDDDHPADYTAQNPNLEA